MVEFGSRQYLKAPKNGAVGGVATARACRRGHNRAQKHERE
jgi:hypothetical protein